LISVRTGMWVLVGFTLAVAAAAVLAPRIPPSQSYHDFADRRALLGIPNFGDVASNLLFAVSGGWGLVFLFAQRGHERFIDPRERWAFCGGTAKREKLEICASTRRRRYMQC
jgi:hypothetical protein